MLCTESKLLLNYENTTFSKKWTNKGMKAFGTMIFKFTLM